MAYLRKQPQPPLHRPLLARLLLWLADNDCNAGKRGRLRRLPLAAAASERAARRAREQGRPRRAGGAGRVGRGGARAHRGGRVCGRRRAGAAGGDLCRRRLAAGAGPLHHVWRAARGRPPVRVAAAGPPSLPGARKRGAARLARMARPRARAGAQRAPASPCLSRTSPFIAVRGVPPCQHGAYLALAAGGAVRARARQARPRGPRCTRTQRPRHHAVHDAASGSMRLPLTQPYRRRSSTAQGHQAYCRRRRFSWASQQLVDLEYDWTVRGDPRPLGPPASPEAPMPLVLEDNITTAAPGLEQCAPQPLRRSALPALGGRWRASPVRPCCASALLRPCCVRNAAPR